MAHAQICPVCMGKGKLPNGDICNGCFGRGWVEVSDNGWYPIYPYPVYPYYPPYTITWTWTYTPTTKYV
jgi:hypothetical protein